MNKSQSQFLQPPVHPDGSSTHLHVNSKIPSFSPGSHASPENLAKFRHLLKPHVESYNYFIEKGLTAIAPVLDEETRSIRGNLYTSQSSIERLGVPKYTVELKTRDSAEVKCKHVKIWFESLTTMPPTSTQKDLKTNRPRPLLPRECRELGTSYTSNLSGIFCAQNFDESGESVGKTIRLTRSLGDLPVMVSSSLCHTYKKSPAGLLKLKEESAEFGGHFIVSGIERCIRLLQVPRRNHPLSIRRPTYKSRGPTYSEFGCSMRCSRFNGDCSTISNTLHYLTSGGVTLRFTCRKQEFLLPLIVLIKALKPSVTDSSIYKRLVSTDEKNTFLKARVELLLHDSKQFGLFTQQECLAYIGARFRSISSRGDLVESDVDVGRFIIAQYVMVHLKYDEDKLATLEIMLKKLYSFVQGSTAEDNSDSLQNLEILCPGHLICSIVKEKIEEGLLEVRKGLMIEMRKNNGKDYAKICKGVTESTFWGKSLDKYGSTSTIGKKIGVFLSTGNLVSSTGLDLMQVSGFTIVAERLNFLRYISHYRSVHRGQFFTTMKTTTVRKLLPDSWGFLCPVHTPDGGPCGLLNHMACVAEVKTSPSKCNVQDIDGMLIELGVIPAGPGGSAYDGNRNLGHTMLPVCVDGRVIGGASIKECKRISLELRNLKVQTNPIVPNDLEIALFPPLESGCGPFPGMFLFTGSARMIRPVIHRGSGKTEYIGPMEQPFLSIACLPDDVREGDTTHMEIDPSNILSLVASMTPFSDYNQSPRNMYQCQMGKQTMGTPCMSWPHRTDNKMYKIQNPQAPIVQTSRHAEFQMDDHPNGCNAVVAVLSYTGFDMEDAMILCKSSYERGFGHASVYKTKTIDLKDEGERAGVQGEKGKPRLRFNNRKPSKTKEQLEAVQKIREKKGEEFNEVEESEFYEPTVGDDGLPIVGQWLEEGDPMYVYTDDLTGKAKVGKHKEMEKACIQNVRLLGSSDVKNSGSGQLTGSGLDRLSVTIRIPRNPVIGDKFSSRHGQKGVLSILWPQVDMPFSESGISPDIIINPHAFPSRMTIGMLIESMAGKSGALHGMYQDATPFNFHESGDKLAVDHFGEQLQSAGYSYYGSEPLYSGVSGALMHADLYIGVVYYQRLRHMVSDKAQVRSTGTINQLTRQPIKGRKKGGGIRLGEMERDALLSHGTAFLLLDRLMNCSDRHVAHCCSRCGGMLSARTERNAILSSGGSELETRLDMVCVSETCEGKIDAIEPIALPYVFKYLSYELAGMGIRMQCQLTE